MQAEIRRGGGVSPGRGEAGSGEGEKHRDLGHLLGRAEDIPGLPADPALRNMRDGQGGEEGDKRGGGQGGADGERGDYQGDQRRQGGEPGRRRGG